MKFNQWTLGLAALGVISLASAVQAEEAQNQVMTALSSTTLSGYVSASAIWKPGNGNVVAPGRSFDGIGKQDGFNLDVVKLQLEKPVDEGQWAAGYQAGLLFGPDANTYGTTSTGFATSDFGIKDANVTLRAPLGNGLDFKLGYWESPIGYEVFDLGSNPNYSRSFGYAIEPKQFTGLLASYRVNDMIKIEGGVANTGLGIGAGPGNTATVFVNNAINGRTAKIESLKTYIGAVTLTAPESLGMLKGAQLYAGIVDSGVAGAPDIQSYYVGASIPTPLEGLALGACGDYRSNSGGNGISSTHASSLAGYLTYQVTEKLKLNNRVEWATGSNNTWYFVPLTAKHQSNDLLGYTFTADYSLWGNVITRGEFRWDHELNGNGIFNDGSDKNTVSLVLNVIYKF